jgi:hypothetical protein
MHHLVPLAGLGDAFMGSGFEEEGACPLQTKIGLTKVRNEAIYGALSHFCHARSARRISMKVKISASVFAQSVLICSHV